jgi:hypothetical protein
LLIKERELHFKKSCKGLARLPFNLNRYELQEQIKLFILNNGSKNREMLLNPANKCTE